MPQSQTAALPRPQEEEETDKSKQAQTEQVSVVVELYTEKVTMPISEYIQLETGHPKSMIFCQVHSHRYFYKQFFFLLAIIQWIALPESAVCLPALDAF